MTHLHLPWLELCVAIPLLGAAGVARLRSPVRAQAWSLFFTGLTFVGALGAWQDFYWLRTTTASDPGSLLVRWTGSEWLSVDELSAPLLPLTALLYLLTGLVTLRTKSRRFSFAWTLAAEALVLAALCCHRAWGLTALLAMSAVPPYIELRLRQKPSRIYALHMVLFVALLFLGRCLVEREGASGTASLSIDPSPTAAWWAVLPLVVAVLIRGGIAPFHLWMTDLFEHATFGRALLFVTPMIGTYAAARLVLPIAPAWLLNAIGLLALVTAVYASAMSLVQSEPRRFFCYIFLSHSALVLVGLATASSIGLTGALCLWLSVGLSLAGFGLTLRALEARHGRASLASYHGYYAQTPLLALCFLLTGLASVGFPGTIGFVGAELLVDGAVEAYPHVGVVVALAAALNGIAVVKAYFALFTGTRQAAAVPLHVGWREQVAVLTLTALIIGGGLYPQPGVADRHRAAEAILSQRTPDSPGPHTDTLTLIDLTSAP